MSYLPYHAGELKHLSAQLQQLVNKRLDGLLKADEANRISVSWHGSGGNGAREKGGREGTKRKGGMMGVSGRCAREGEGKSLKNHAR